MPHYEELFRQLDPPLTEYDRGFLGDSFADELATVSRLWFACGYRPGIGAYLNFFLLADFITLHDEAFPPRFESFKAMAKSFYETDLFVRDVTDSGAEATGGISARRVRALLAGIMGRHARLKVPKWMMTYFGFSLVENVEKQTEPLADADKQLHLAYMSRAYRIMGMPFSADRALMEQFARSVEKEHVGLTPQLDKHARHILVLGEMVGVSSRPDVICAMLPASTRAMFEPHASRLRPNALKRSFARVMGRMLMKRAVGEPRAAVPVDE